MLASSTYKGRRAHQKSRNGCQQCKRRKVKCDESKPMCNKCKTYGVDCSFMLPPQAGEAATSPEPPRGFGKPQAPASALLHHYTTSTAYTFSKHPALQTLWRIDVPEIGFTTPYALRAILALSALHLAVLRREKKAIYISQASEHHDVALRLATPEISKISHENATPLFFFSALLSFICCVKPLRLGNFLLWEDHEIADWLLLIKGTGTIVESASESLKAGPLGIMFSVHRHTDSQPAVQHQFLEDLRHFILDEVKDGHEREVYCAAIGHLSDCFTICLNNGWRLETADVFMWLLRIPHDFLFLLNGHQPHAMVIIAYFCVLLHQLERMWWMKNWGTHILSQIHHLLPEPIYKAWLQWPMEQIGFLPST
ncbi:hypothetical protein BDW72DRAFT_214131 [Aspergillus terricola var. indicus]